MTIGANKWLIACLDHMVSEVAFPVILKRICTYGGEEGWEDYRR